MVPTNRHQLLIPRNLHILSTFCYPFTSFPLRISKTCYGIFQRVGIVFITKCSTSLTDLYNFAFLSFADICLWSWKVNSITKCNHELTCKQLTNKETFVEYFNKTNFYIVIRRIFKNPLIEKLTREKSQLSWVWFRLRSHDAFTIGKRNQFENDGSYFLGI